MPLCSNAERRTPGTGAGRRALGALVLLVAAVGGSARAGTGEEVFPVRDASTRLVDGVYLLDAAIDYRFSQESMEAMENGVPLVVLVEMEVRRLRAGLWDPLVARVQARFRVQTHPLSKRYVVTNLNAHESRTYRSFEEMVGALGQIRNYPMLDRHLVDLSQRYVLRLRARLDIEALPSPLRPLAYLSSLWRLQDTWSEWPVTP